MYNQIIEMLRQYDEEKPIVSSQPDLSGTSASKEDTRASRRRRTHWPAPLDLVSSC